MTKSLQTGLLLVTGLAGYMSARCPVTNWQTLLALMGSLFLSIGGSTVLNMYYDRDIDAQMTRTCQRPLPSGLVAPREALWLGAIMAAAGTAWAFGLSPLYGALVFAGLVFDVAVYTIWLKRRTPYAIVMGGLAGGMPALAGRSLGVGAIDAVGVLLAVAVLFWIPTHIITFSMRHNEDYERAGVPIFSSLYSPDIAQRIVAASAVVAAAAMIVVATGLRMTGTSIALLVAADVGLLALASLSVMRPSARTNFVLFKYASAYMLGSMLLIIAGVT